MAAERKARLNEIGFLCDNVSPYKEKGGRNEMVLQ
jgi:hypothetical protein